ncbi:MAG: PD-(D/E)XK nuclease family protein [Oscillospiraceae bacterium]|nr:PD-(D/E)XK nuclease family protein [Oscillospiraceae bacterium]
MESNQMEALKQLLLDSDLNKLESKIDNSVNIFDILNVVNREIRHSNMLAWLLNPNENHGLGDEFIKRLINYLIENRHISDSEEAIKLLMCNHFDFNVQREHYNIDLLLTSSEAKTVIAVENKISTNEHGDQLSRYKNTVEKYYPEYKRYYLYLTLYGDDSSEPDIWRSIGYEEIIEWLRKSLKSQSLRPEVNHILEQYCLTLERITNMEYSPQIKELCKKIYKNHKEALNIIRDVVDEGDNCKLNVSEWCEEWIENKHITLYGIESRSIWFSTKFLDEMFPLDKYGNPPCYYCISNFPAPNGIYIEFGSQRLNKAILKKFQKIKPFFNKNVLKDDWQWHRLKRWGFDYNPKRIEEFSEVSDNLKKELEKIIFHKIPEFEKEVAKILEE